MQPKTRRWILISGALATATTLGVAGALLWSPDPGGSETKNAPASQPAERQSILPAEVAQSFVSALFSSDATLAANMTDASDAATTAITDSKRVSPGRSEINHRNKVPISSVSE